MTSAAERERDKVKKDEKRATRRRPVKGEGKERNSAKHLERGTEEWRVVRKCSVTTAPARPSMCVEWDGADSRAVLFGRA